MAHVTFIHGLSNKPESEYLHNLWKRKLAHEDGLNLDTNQVGARMVYWADVFYSEPDKDLAAYESAAVGAEALQEASEKVPLDLSKLSPEDQQRIKRLAKALQVTDDDFDPGTLSQKERQDIEFERIPLPAGLRNRLMAKLVRDAHHYFFNVEYSPRPGVKYRVRDELRKRFIDGLKAVTDAERPLVVVSHSMGTIIAYDCLMHVDQCPPVDGLMTIGSPLGLDEIQDFFPNWSRDNGFPSAKLKGRWVNVFDPLDVVAGFDPFFANDYRRQGMAVVEDVSESNWGTWRHSISKYLQGQQLRSCLAALLKVQWP